MADLRSSANVIGLFSAHGDVGAVKHPGSVEYSADLGTYTVSGSGVNMWFREDAFHFVWKEFTGDLFLAADCAFMGSGVDPHRKACLLIRQSLDANSAYVDAAWHGDGLVALQYRDETGETTHDIHSNVVAPRRIAIEKRGDTFMMLVSGEDGIFQPAGGSVRVCMEGSYYVGLGVCSHNADVLETAVFSNVELFEPPISKQATLYSTLETVAINSTDRTVVHVFKGHIEAPNWTPDGRELIYNSGGLLYRIPVSGGESTLIDTGFANRCNNDHGLSPDGKTIVISDHSQPPGQSIIYTLPIEGGVPTQITAHYPSYWHGWSPDGETLAYCAERDGKFGIFTIPVSGGEETRLTTADRLGSC